MLNDRPMPFDDWYAKVSKDFIRGLLDLGPEDPLPDEDDGTECASCGGSGEVSLEHTWKDLSGEMRRHVYEVTCEYCSGYGATDSREMRLVKRYYEGQKAQDLENLKRYNATGTI